MQDYAKKRHGCISASDMCMGGFSKGLVVRRWVHFLDSAGSFDAAAYRSTWLALGSRAWHRSTNELPRATTLRGLDRARREDGNRRCSGCRQRGS